MKKVMFLVSICCVMLFPMTAHAAPLADEPAWEYIIQKYPKGITAQEASAEGIKQPLFQYFEGYARP